KYDGHNYNTSGSYPFGQCTWYVYNRMAQIGKRVDDFMGNGGEWGTKGRALGYKVTNTPKVGTAISFPPGSFGSSPVYGHVAFVEVVNADGTLLISECNVVNPGSGTVSYRVVPKGIAAIASYVEGK
ncbi:CHAP domain-containing protein, partial [Shigella sonnei]|nr:CHAP domain-containing protein [Shigella sonnei]